MKYAEAKRLIATARDKVSKPLGNNTYVENLGDCLAVRFHHTYVVTYFLDGSIVLDSDRWRTETTKARMNEYLPEGWSVYQERGTWYLDHWKGLQRRTFIFHDGIRIGPRGGCNGKRREKKSR